MDAQFSSGERIIGLWHVGCGISNASSCLDRRVSPCRFLPGPCRLGRTHDISAKRQNARALSLTRLLGCGDGRCVCDPGRGSAGGGLPDQTGARVRALRAGRGRRPDDAVIGRQARRAVEAAVRDREPPGRRRHRVGDAGAARSGRRLHAWRDRQWTSDQRLALHAASLRRAEGFHAHFSGGEFRDVARGAGQFALQVAPRYRRRRKEKSRKAQSRRHQSRQHAKPFGVPVPAGDGSSIYGRHLSHDTRAGYGAAARRRRPWLRLLRRIYQRDWRRKTADRRHLGRGTRSLAQRHPDREGRRLPPIRRDQLERGRGARQACRPRSFRLSTVRSTAPLPPRTFRKRHAGSVWMRAQARRSKCTTAWRRTSPNGAPLSTKPAFRNNSAHTGFGSVRDQTGRGPRQNGIGRMEWRTSRT